MTAPHAIHGDFRGDTDRIGPLKMTGSGCAWLPEEYERAESWRAPLPDDAGIGLRKCSAMYRDEAVCFVTGG